MEKSGKPKEKRGRKKKNGRKSGEIANNLANGHFFLDRKQKNKHEAALNPIPKLSVLSTDPARSSDSLCFSNICCMSGGREQHHQTFFIYTGGQSGCWGGAKETDEKGHGQTEKEVVRSDLQTEKQTPKANPHLV